MNTVALIVAAGRGVRFGGDIPKQFRIILDRPLLAWTAMQFEKARLVDEIVLVIAEDFMLYAGDKVVKQSSFAKLKRIIKGGETRRESVLNGLKALPISTGFVAIHDGARPLVDAADIDRVIAVAHKERAAILARPIADTVKRVEADYVISSLDRSKLYRAETPQVFQYDLIKSAHEKYISGREVTDDSALVEALGFKVRTVIPEKRNLKVTTEEDMQLAKMIIEENNREA
ncbi:MAG: 2-C-methyl-D-erythritol 4-phosphate cytidylyltransferase [candidate division Zixibacteria bacterium HGW-Zixibacteria-1]|nr:MAG: 2-C-methyl-D-erythritol 4-phosphate cytidylyltransferase [candidate division Zixibacteria bacterium HGW-Zixibacteria-1]